MAMLCVKLIGPNWGNPYNSMKDELDAQWLATNTTPAGGILKLTSLDVFQYYDAFGELAIRGANHGGGAKTLIMQSDYGRFSCTPSGTRRKTPYG